MHSYVEVVLTQNKAAFGPYKNVAIYINSALFLVNITLDLGVWNDDL